MRLVADVAVLAAVPTPLSYEVPPTLAAAALPGARVACPIGRRMVAGVVLGVERRFVEDLRKLRPIAGVLDDEPALPPELLRFLLQLSDYYLAPPGEVMRLALPAVARERLEGLRFEGELFADARVEGPKAIATRTVTFVRATEKLEAAGALRGQAALILALLRSVGEATLPSLVTRFGNARAAVRKLADAGLVAVEERERPDDPFFVEPVPRDTPPDLTAAQLAATRRIGDALARAARGAAAAPVDPGAFLLFGVTGSGKTEVYLRAIAECLELGRGALVLVPEIALTPQLVARFRARFGDDVAVLHSGLTDRERHAMWRRLRRGQVTVAIGARSALFAPVPELGLVIVDEEHDSSFKQEEGVRYHARDMALLRSHRAGAVCVLGSATPSLESVALVERGRVTRLDLPDRARAEARLPAVSIVDLRRNGPGPSGDPLLSLPLHRALEQTLAAGEQAILFLNRRGFAPSVVCDACGALETCPACSVGLTFHRAARHDTPHLAGTLRCHYCDYHAPLGDVCSACQAPALVLEGLGTERLEVTVAECFPTARVARLDRDVAQGAEGEAILERMRQGELDVLVGTQMVTKGHDLPRVTLVGVVNADAALSIPDFRASERGFSLLVQVAGRAGRHDKPGRVLIQTRNPTHPAIELAARHDVEGFWRRELADRRETTYPPFSRLALLRFDAMDEDVVREAAALVAAQARTLPAVLQRHVAVLGPSAAPLARLRGRYRFRVLLRAAERRPLRAVLDALLHATRRLDHRVRMAVDVDPVQML